MIKLPLLTELRMYAERNRAPGHPLRPVRHQRHIVYRPKADFGMRRGQMMLLPPTSFEVYRGRYLLGMVVRMKRGDWFAWTADKGPGMGSFRTRAHAAKSLLDRMSAGRACHAFGGLCALLPNPLWDDTKPDRRGPHYCNVFRMRETHYCLCVCGIYLDLDRRRADERG